MFDVIIPIYQIDPKILRFCLESVKHQTFFEYEVWIIDGTPYDWEKYEEVLEVVSDFSEFNYMRQGNRGVSGARNQGFSVGINPYIAFLDGDDFWFPNHLQTMYDSIVDSDDDVGLWWSYVVSPLEMEEKTCYVQQHIYEDIELYDNMCGVLRDYIILPSVAVCKREDYRECGGFDEGMLAYEDYDFFYRIGLLDKKGVFIDNWGCIALPSDDSRKLPNAWDEGADSLKEKWPDLTFTDTKKRYNVVWGDEYPIYPDEKLIKMCFEDYPWELTSDYDPSIHGSKVSGFSLG